LYRDTFARKDILAVRAHHGNYNKTTIVTGIDTPVKQCYSEKEANILNEVQG
jgi:hypothetical protein